ncbi:M13-type metalloendopeptidase [Rhodocytophaga aerolata]|uniref:M13-type metalloendopeptidase n=1 Tax=Rhodocytophaga aerolata TaxID=455078 RepID=A0ABT8QY58_9BACT|nr:M13-type metalloendopeptidase [Rhodocytophaga aerolata]MDO1444772.1 M13-type metalloendopeptidase [Rhodocytophaga aerolata]
MISISSCPKMLALAASVWLMASCTSQNVQETTQPGNKTDQPLTSGITIQNMDTLVKPGDNFTAYVNGNWVKNTEIPADKAAFGAFHMLNDKAQDDVKAIIEASASGTFADGSDEQKVGDFYEAYMNLQRRDSIGLAPLAPELKKIADIATYTDLATYFAYANKMGNMVPFNIGVETDFKDPKQYMLYTWQGGLGLPDREYYFLKDAKSTDIRNKYVAHIENMLKLSGIENGKEKAKKIMALETQLASKHMKKEQTRDMVAIYNKYAVKDLTQLMPDFAWQPLLKEAGVEKKDSIVITQVDYTKSLNAIIKNTPLDTWKTYLQWSLIHGSASYLTTALDQENFEFYNKTLYGVKEQRPQWRRAVDVVNNNLGEMVGKVYVKKHFPPQAKERMLTLVDNLLKAYESSIKELEWMSEDTKKQALDKLSKFTPKIGYPDKWRDYSDLKVAKGDLYGNMKRSTLFEYNRNINKLGKPVDRDEWGMTPQTVNAYYNPPLNEIVFPAAILQPPFFDLNAEDAVNYGGIGGVIGHEIGHGFDDQGSTFDGDGVLRNWWTEKDGQEFKTRTSALVSQYNNFKVFDDLNVNGEFTLGENIGDLGGLSIALKAYNASLNGKPAPVLDGFTGNQRVFIGWAQAWLNKSRDEALRNQINTDPHSPAKFRVNGVVRNIPEFYTAFNVQPSDSLYLAPEQRVKIW